MTAFYARFVPSLPSYVALTQLATPLWWPIDRWPVPAIGLPRLLPLAMNRRRPAVLGQRYLRTSVRWSQRDNAGIAEVTLGQEQRMVGPGAVAFIPAGCCRGRGIWG